MAAAPTAGRPAAKSILTRGSQPTEAPISRANHTDSTAKRTISVVKRTSATISLSDDASTQQSARRTTGTDIPRNPLR